MVTFMAVAILAILTQSGSAQPSSTDINILPTTSNLTASPKAFEAWAQFCDDLDCTNNCGIWMDISSSDCLQESGRWSVLIKSHGQNTEVGLVYSPADSCNCQQQCDQFSETGCYALNKTLAPDTFSYRWVNIGHQYDACASNNC